MSVDQVVTGQVHRGVMHRVDEVWLHHGVVGMLHGIGGVDDIHLGIVKNRKNKNNVYFVASVRYNTGGQGTACTPLV